MAITSRHAVALYWAGREGFDRSWLLAGRIDLGEPACFGCGVEAGGGAAYLKVIREGFAPIVTVRWCFTHKRTAHAGAREVRYSWSNQRSARFPSEASALDFAAGKWPQLVAAVSA